MTFRAVQLEAGQKNKSAAQYHFGDRDGLVRSVVATRMAPINDRRTQMLLLNGEGLALRDLVEILVVPVAEAVLLQPESCWARFLLQSMSDPILGQVALASVEGAAYRTVSDRIQEELSQLPGPIARRRFNHVVGLLFLNLAAAERAQAEKLPSDLPIYAVITDLVDTSLALLQAPSSVMGSVAGAANSTS